MGCKLTPEEILEDFKSFYYDTALSAWGPNLAAMDKFVLPTQILFGTDFPGEWAGLPWLLFLPLWLSGSQTPV